MRPTVSVLTRWLGAVRPRRSEIFCGIAFGAFAILAVLAHRYDYFAWDIAVARWLQAIPGLRRLMQVVSFPGSGWRPFALTGATALAFASCRRVSEAVGLALSPATSALLNYASKEIVGRPRPAPNLVSILRVLFDPSFPSGHVTFYVSYFGFLFFLAYTELPRGSRWRYPLLALTAIPILLVGVSRVYLGKHWPSDVLGAYLLSGGWLAVSINIYRRWKTRTSTQGGMAPR